MSESKTVTVTLDEMLDGAEARVRSGAYASLSEVVQEGLRALDREDEWLREAVRESLDDPRPSIPAEEVFADLERRYEEDVSKERKGARRRAP
jgi:antitoxin ParD1/3/4